MTRDFFLMLFAMAMLVACGQTGPLYLPEAQPVPEVQPSAQQETENANKTDAAADAAGEGNPEDRGVELKEKTQ